MTVWTNQKPHRSGTWVWRTINGPIRMGVVDVDYGGNPKIYPLVFVPLPDGSIPVESYVRLDEFIKDLGNGVLWHYAGPMMDSQWNISPYETMEDFLKDFDKFNKEKEEE